MTSGLVLSFKLILGTVSLYLVVISFVAMYVLDNYDNFDQTIMDIEASQIEDPVYQAPRPANHYGATTEETCSQCFTPLTCN